VTLFLGPKQGFDIMVSKFEKTGSLGSREPIEGLRVNNLTLACPLLPVAVLSKRKSSHNVCRPITCCFVGIPVATWDSQSVVPEHLASVSPGNLLQMQIFGLYPRLAESQPLA
jgi:hypothetical protein